MNLNQNLERKTSFKQTIQKICKFIVDECIKFPAYILFHPIKGYEMFKRENRARMSVSIIFVIIQIIITILAFQYEGFLVNPRKITDLNIFAEIAYIIVPILLITFANWSITTLFDGKGKVKDIFMMICYAQFPLIICKALGILISNVIVEDEVGFYSVVLVLGTIFMCYMVFFGMITIHEFGLKKCVLTILATVISLAIILYALFLFFDLFQKVYGFLYVVYREITIRNLIW